MRWGAALISWRHRLNLPTLVLQGYRDPLVKPELTRQLLRQFAGPIEYVEIDAQHDLIDPALPAWPRLEQALRDFLPTLALD